MSIFKDNLLCFRAVLNPEHMNVKFVGFLLDTIECPPANDEADAVPDVFVKLLLAFNLHFQLPSDNLVMSTVAGRGTAKTFTEKLMLLFNREGQLVSLDLELCVLIELMCYRINI